MLAITSISQPIRTPARNNTGNKKAFQSLGSFEDLLTSQEGIIDADFEDVHSEAKNAQSGDYLPMYSYLLKKVYVDYYA